MRVLIARCALLVVLSACNKPLAKARLKAVENAVEPKMSATVITIQTILQPQNKTLTHSIVMAHGHARSDDELDRWRLFDVEHNTITYVDDIARTYYTVPANGVQRPSAAAEGGGPAPVATGAKRVILGVEASQFLVRMGGYQRELWIGAPKAVPPQLFGMMHEDLAELPGFPLLDHAELPYGNTKMVVDRRVIKIERKNVAQSLLNIPGDYKNITAPGVNHPPASSPQPGQSTRATE